jgi:hypothetical protein
LVLTDHDAHGITASTRVPPPARVPTVRAPSSAATRSAIPRIPPPSSRTRPVPRLDDGAAENHVSAAATRALEVVAVNDAPVLTSTAVGAPTYTEDGAPQPVDDGIEYTDAAGTLVTLPSPSYTG